MDQLIIIAVVLLLVILAAAFLIFRPRGDVDVKRRLAGDDEPTPTIAGPNVTRRAVAPGGDADQPAQRAPGGGSGYGGPVKSDVTYTTPRFVSKEEAPAAFDDDPPGPLFAPREAGAQSNGDVTFDRRAVRPGDAPIPGGPASDERAIGWGGPPPVPDQPEESDAEPESGAPPA